MFKKLVLTLGILVLTLMSFQSAFAGIDGVELRVDGLTCPFCVYGVEKKLKGVEFVEDAKASLKTGIVQIKVRNGKAVDTDRLNKAVKESGFTPGDIEITATGSLTEKDGHPALKVTGSDQVFLLVGGHKHDKEELLSKEKIDEIKAATENGAITITGHVYTHTDFPTALSVDSFEAK